MRKLTKTHGMCKQAEKSLKTKETRARGIFWAEAGRKLILGILRIVNNVFKLIYPTMMSKNLKDVGKTLLKDIIKHSSKATMDYSKFESTATAHHIEVVCRSMLPKLIAACPDAFGSNLVDEETIQFLVGVFLEDPDPWITLEKKDHYTGKKTVDAMYSCIATVVSGRARVMLNSMLNVVYTLTLFTHWCDIKGIKWRGD